MTADTTLSYFRARWPDEIVPEGEPLWLLYEVDMVADAVLRTVDVFPDGRITRNSIEIDQPQNGHFESLMDVSFVETFEYNNVELVQKITKDEFENLYSEGVDKPFWFPRER